MQQVWILSKGEQHEGGEVLGVYADKELAKGQFLQEAQNLSFAIDDARQDADGSISLYAGCDFLELRPYQLHVRNEIEN